MRFRHKFLALALVSSVVVATPAVANEQAFAVLNGGFEVPPADPADPNGHGAASVLFYNATRICVAISVARIIPPTAMHIHRGKAGVSGPPVVTLIAPAAGNPGASGACYGPLMAALVREIRNFPERFYINVHTNGAIRGQLF